MTWTMIWTMAGVTWARLRRGRALWIGLVIAALPVVFAYLWAARGRSTDDTALMIATTPILVLLPPLFVASSIGEELESRTSTYLWSRPIARWAIIAGKLGALAPLAIALALAGWTLAHMVGPHAAPSAVSCLAIGLGCAVVAIAAAAIALVAPRHGMALAITYLLVDSFIGAWPFSLAQVSVTHQVRALAGGDGLAAPALALIAIGAIWALIGLARVRRLEV